MDMTFKRKLTKILSALLLLLTCICLSIIIFVNSPLHPGGVSDEAVADKGIEYVIKLKGITECDENGFTLATDGFYFVSEPIYVYVGEDGYARTSYEPVLGIKISGKHCSSTVAYESYSFCGETYKTKEELQEFFYSPDHIYNFSLDDLSTYIQNNISYEKQFSGKAVIKVYRGRCVITEVYIYDEKVLEFKE